MHFKIDYELQRLARLVNLPEERISKDLCRASVKAGLAVEYKGSYTDYGHKVKEATRFEKVAKVAGCLIDFLGRGIDSDIFDAFCNLTFWGEGDCPRCGGEIKATGEEFGHYKKNGNGYDLAPDWVVDGEVFECCNCGHKIPDMFNL